MNPALSSGDILLVSESAYKEAEPGRFDLIVFKYKYDIHTRYIKRVIGLPGETVEIKDNTIYINGEELKEYYGYYDGERKWTIMRHIPCERMNTLYWEITGNIVWTADPGMWGR